MDEVIDPNDEISLIRVMEDMIALKGSTLEPFRNEYLELKKQNDLMIANVIGKEREVESLNSELSGIRDQITFTRRNIDEIISTQETIKHTVDNINSVKASLTDSEKTNRDKIVVYTGYFEELKEALSIGADWTPEQAEQRQALEKERDFLQGKLESRSNQVDGIRGDVDRIYSNIQQLEVEIATHEENVNKLTSKAKDVQKEVTQTNSMKENSEKKLLELRALIVKDEAGLVCNNNWVLFFLLHGVAV